MTTTTDREKSCRACGGEGYVHAGKCPYCDDRRKVTHAVLTKDVEAIGALAPEVGEAHAALRSALADKRRYEGKLLDSIVEMVRPALNAIASRVQIGEAFYSGEHNGETKTYSSAFKGAALAGPGVVREKDRDGGFTGAYTGRTLYLTAAGSWVELTYDGSFNQWQGSRCHWQATETRHADGAAVVAAGFDVEEIVRTLAQLLREQASGNASRRAARIRNEAERLDAVRILLDGGRS